MKFLDLHSHPVTKTLFNDLSPWDPIPVPDKLLASLLESQTNLHQISMSGSNLLCLTLAPVEAGMLDNWLLQLASIFTEALDGEIMGRMIDGSYSYQQVLKTERKNLNKPPRDTEIPVKTIHVLKSFSEYDINDDKTLYVFFNLEGGHIFYGEKNSPDNVDQILEDYSKFVSDPSHLVLFITPTHLTPNIFITHAYANKILSKGAFLPKGYGISKNGERFLDKITDSGVLVDVKHMSLVARQTFYQNSKWIKHPVLCSHGGVTGISWNDKLDSTVVLEKIKKGPGFYKIRYIKPRGLIKDTYFNPCSINLYDEDIVNILGTKGLIGLIMDLRIMGGERDLFGNLKLIEDEFVAEEEFVEWQRQVKTIAPLNPDDFESPYPAAAGLNNELTDYIWDEEDLAHQFEELNDLSQADIEKYYKSFVYRSSEQKEPVISKPRDEEHLRYFANQVLHIVKVAENARLAVNPWDHIGIGSDFDGFIRAIDPCQKITDVNSFGEKLITRLPVFASEAKVILPADPRLLVENILFNNAYKFISGHFNDHQDETPDSL